MTRRMPGPDDDFPGRAVDERLACKNVQGSDGRLTGFTQRECSVIGQASSDVECVYDAQNAGLLVSGRSIERDIAIHLKQPTVLDRGSNRGAAEHYLAASGNGEFSGANHDRLHIPQGQARVDLTFDLHHCRGIEKDKGAMERVDLTAIPDPPYKVDAEERETTQLEHAVVRECARGVAEGCSGFSERCRLRQFCADSICGWRCIGQSA